ncbi:MAG TPA: response regulator [Polyangiaceae bacterium]|jgi:CheY-like chemotaxis protein
MPTKVLVFESDPAFAGELRNELGKLGCATTVVDDGNVGLQQAASERPDLVLLSIELPRMNGFSVCNKLKKDQSLKDVPLIIMSSESSDETFEQHKKLRTRAEDYVHKPIAFGELLRHIQPFVRLGASVPPDGDSAIVIDDDIEIGSTDYMTDDDGTQIAPRPPSGMPLAASSTQRNVEPVDADVDAFADAAFGRLTKSEPPGAGVAQAEAKPIHNGAPEPASMPPRRATTPPVRQASVKPPSGVDIAEYEKIREDLVRTRARAGEIERELGEVKNEIDKWRLEAAESERLAREVEELKTKLASGAPKSAGISSREFLDLREALNKKDKEILALKEQSSRKDKELVEAQDRTLALERSKADLDDKAITLERELTETKEKSEALAADKDLAKKASEDFKSRLEKARAELESKERHATEARQRHAEDMASTEAKLAALRADLDQTLANERAEQARALDQAEERRKADLDQARRDREAAVVEAREQVDREKQDALSSQAAQLKQEHEGKMAALHRAHQQEVEKVRGEGERSLRDAEAQLEAAASAARDEQQKAVARARDEAEKAREEALEAMRGEHAEKVSALENDRDARLAAIEARATREIAEANDKLAKGDMDLSAARGELASLRESKEAADAAHEAAAADLQKRLTDTTADLGTKLADATSARDDLEKKHGAASDKVVALEAELATARHELGEARQKLAGESSRADKAHAKWDADRQSLERAKDALAVALAQIEEAEGRPLS